MKPIDSFRFQEAFTAPTKAAAVVETPALPVTDPRPGFIGFLGNLVQELAGEAEWTQECWTGEGYNENDTLLDLALPLHEAGFAADEAADEIIARRTGFDIGGEA